ncbi:MAG: hypothetical protein QM703_20360 [Gemmatales bacterium]
MPLEAKLGLVFGVALTILVAIYFRPKESALSNPNPPPPITAKISQPAPGETTSIRK